MRQGQVKVCCVTPVFNDWESFDILRKKIAALALDGSDISYNVIAIDDGSVEQPSETSSWPESVSLVRLKVNVGHQRAIAVGLQYVFSEASNYDYYVVMDSDGEDLPEHLPHLVAAAREHEDSIVFAERNRRHESRTFKIGYFFYRLLFHFLTGQQISFGNFSIIPRKLLKKVVYQNHLWNHYSGSIIQSRIPFTKVSLDRGVRYRGKSKMNMNSLILHGLSSISVYFDVLSIRILRFSLIGVVICGAGIAYILYQKLFTENAIPGWASSLILIISIIAIQLFSITAIVLLMQLSSRKNVNVPNHQTYEGFIDRNTD